MTQGQSASTGASAASTAANATVAAIEVVPRSTSAATEGDSAAMGSSAGGSTGSASGDQHIYRVTLRMDDGSTQVVTQQMTPDFRTGDRVSLMGGAIQR
jgi:outer membrane lipoprotein SlyB